MVEDGVMSKEDAEWIKQRIEVRRQQGESRLSELNPRAIKILSKHRERILKHLENKDPEAYEHMKSIVSYIHEE